MSEFTPSLADLFGANAQLTADQLIISKADLAEVGLDEYPANLGAIFVALLLVAKASYQGAIVDETGAIIINAQDVAIGYDFNRISPQLNIGLEADYFANNKRNQEIHVRFYTG